MSETLYNWLKQCRERGMLVPGNRNTGKDWSAGAKLAIVIETAVLSETELNAYCRENGLYVEQIQSWEAACLQDAGQQQSQHKETQRKQKQIKKAIRKLEAELRRKDKVLAETTSLLVKWSSDLGQFLRF